MESGLSIRLSPFAEYSITRNISNFLGITDLDKKVYCKGENIVLNYQKTGSFESSNQIKVEISDKNGENFKEISNYEVFNNTQIKVKVEQAWENGGNYRLVIKSTLPYSESPVSENFEIKSLPSAEISSVQKTINRGDELQLNLKFGGSGPWYFKDWDGAVYEKINSSSVNFNLNPDSSQLYFISEISNECGVISQSPSVFIEVLQPSLQIQSNGIFCNETLIDLPISGIKTNENPDYFQVQIKNNTEIINVLPNTTLNSVKFYLPQEIRKDITYTLRIVGKKPSEFSNIISFSVNAPPQQPSIVTPVHVCLGTEDYILKANGQNLKWYTEPTSEDFTYSVLLNTQIASKKVYYVSQSDTNQCESPKSKMEVIVDDSVAAEIKGNSNIFLGDSTSINICLKGSPPWKLTIDPLGDFNVNTPEMKIIINPVLSTAYRLSKVSNYCGQGTVSGQADVTVLYILGSPIPEYPEIKVYPNPFYGQSIFYELSNDSITEIIIYSLEGKKIKAFKVNKSLKGEIFLPNLDSGKYNLKFIGSKKNYNFQILK
jgi:DNA-binding Lrp family transcriptional regulator